MNVLTIDTSQLTQFAGKLQNMSKALEQTVDDVLNKNAIEMRQSAIDNITKNKTIDEGFLRSAILPVIDEPLKKTISAAKFYAAYIEFGTGEYAAAYVTGLPYDWYQLASSFKGKAGHGGLYEFFLAILAWIKRKGIKAGRYSVKTHRRLGNKATKFDEDVKLAEAIAYSILKHGIKPRPFLYPAFRKQLPILEKDLDTALKTVI